MKAAGVLFLTRDRRALFLRRGSNGDCPGTWAWPGGRTEDGETAEQCAVRECLEEIGAIPDGSRVYHTRSVQNREVAAPAGTVAPAGAVALPAGPAGASEGALTDQPATETVVVPGETVDFTTFLQRVPAEFIPVLCDEHTGWCWADVDAPPEPLHPGARIALDRLTMDELGVARAMAAGVLTSPQRYGNMSLFDIRITGTGVSYRVGLDEFVFRDPAHYLNEDFLARAMGLTAIMEHPKKATLNSKEYGDRAVGAVMLPYIKGTEVWGITRIYDDDAVTVMSDPENPVSTSPTVVLRPGESSKLTLEDGSTLLIEGKPYLLDHIAICGLGVWDKGGEPAGVVAVADSQADPPPAPGLDGKKLASAVLRAQLLSIQASNLAARRI